MSVSLCMCLLFCPSSILPVLFSVSTRTRGALKDTLFRGDWQVEQIVSDFLHDQDGSKVQPFFYLCVCVCNPFPPVCRCSMRSSASQASTSLWTALSLPPFLEQPPYKQGEEEGKREKNPLSTFEKHTHIHTRGI